MRICIDFKAKQVFAYLIFAGLLCLGQLEAQSFEYDNPNFTPEPYQKEEFPQFLHDLRRFEVITIGTLPISILLSSLAYDIIYSFSTPGNNTLVFTLESDDILAKLGISLGISTLVAVIDLIIHENNKARKRKEIERNKLNSIYIGPQPEPQPSPETQQGSPPTGSPSG